jgi:selenide,water dikinase
MNLVAFPIQTLSSSILKEILRGGLSKIDEAGVALVGGHTIEDQEIKYGLSVTGIIHPDKILSNAKAMAGDKLVLTKPLGTGIISTALKVGMASEKAVREMVESMVSLNRKASELMRVFGAHACTDITGFGFIGHAIEMATASQAGMVIQSEAIPIFPEAMEYARLGLVPGGAYSNRQFFSCKVEVDSNVPDILVDILYDPQTSGGLLISLPSGQVEGLVEALKREGEVNVSVIGEVVKEPEGKIRIV